MNNGTFCAFYFFFTGLELYNMYINNVIYFIKHNIKIHTLTIDFFKKRPHIIIYYN